MPRNLCAMLLHGFLEWLLMTLIVLHGLTFVLLWRAAEFLHLGPPCLLCTRADRLGGDHHRTLRDFLCDAHYPSHELEVRKRWLAGKIPSSERVEEYLRAGGSDHRLDGEQEEDSIEGDGGVDRVVSIGSEIGELEQSVATPAMTPDDDDTQESSKAEASFELTAFVPLPAVDGIIYSKQRSSVQETDAARTAVELERKKMEEQWELQRQQMQAKIELLEAKLFLFEASAAGNDRRRPSRSPSKKSEDSNASAPENGVAESLDVVNVAADDELIEIEDEEGSAIEAVGLGGGSKNYLSLADFMPASAFGSLGQHGDGSAIIFRRNASFVNAMGVDGDEIGAMEE